MTKNFYSNACAEQHRLKSNIAYSEMNRTHVTSQQHVSSHTQPCPL